jgi:DNA-directed RNA polymerase alpha subunit
VKSNTKLANSIRRALMCDVQNYAPTSVSVRENTSCQTDEYIAHRIGLIPFRKTSDDPTKKMVLNVRDRQAMSRDIVGGAFEATVDIPIIKLGPEQHLDLDVEFGQGTGTMHAKFSHIGAVSYQIDADVTHMSFETFEGTDPVQYLIEAINSLSRRVNDTIHFVDSNYDEKKNCHAT